MLLCVTRVYSITSFHGHPGATPEALLSPFYEVSVHIAGGRGAPDVVLLLNPDL